MWYILQCNLQNKERFKYVLYKFKELKNNDIWKI